MENRQNTSSLLSQVDLYSMIRDVVRNLWVILLAAVAVSLIVNMHARTSYNNTYTTSATFVVTSKTGSSYVYSNLSAAARMAESYTNLLNSSLLKKKVCEDLGVDSFDAVMSAGVIQDTNLMTLSVKADSPKAAYGIIHSIIKNMSELTPYVSDDMVMEVLQEPQVPTGADAHFSARGQMKRAFVMAAALFALAFAYLSYRKNTIKGETDLEAKLDAKCLGVIYQDNRRVLDRLLRKKTNRMLVSELNADFEYVERFKKITTHILSRAQKQGAKVIVVTSVREHEGKSTVSANLALTLAQQSHEVLLMDGDLRRPTLNRLFLEPGEKLEATFGELLKGKTNPTKVIRYDEQRKVYLLLNQQEYGNSTDMVSSENMKQLMEACRSAFDYIIVDTPPMSLMADAEALAELGDMSVLVVKYDTALAEDINDAIDSLRDCRATFEGCVLNQVCALPGQRQTVAGYGGYGRYGHYKHYGRYGGGYYGGKYLKEE